MLCQRAACEQSRAAPGTVPGVLTQVHARRHLVGSGAVVGALRLLGLLGQVQVQQEVKAFLITRIHRDPGRTHSLCGEGEEEERRGGEEEERRGGGEEEGREGGEEGRRDGGGQERRREGGEGRWSEEGKEWRRGGGWGD